MSKPRIKLYVIDTGPLITLAAADSLDYLLLPNIPVVIPDAVFYEATREAEKLGAQRIIDWVKAHQSEVELALTETFTNLRDKSRKAQRHMGEQAAVEVIEEPDRIGIDERAILLCEENDVTGKITVNQPAYIVEISTMDFLKGLEQQQRINSADAVFDRAQAAGRNANRIEKFADHDPEIRDAVRETLASAPRNKGRGGPSR